MTEKEIIRNKEEAKKALDIIQSICGYNKCKGCPFSDSDMEEECQFAINHPSTIKIREPEPESDSDWQEFEIDEDGYFYSSNGWRYYYNENVRFEVENADKFKGFGGWLLEDHWYNCLPVSVKNESFPFIIASVTSINEQTKPMFPTKIRFWRRYRE